MTKLKLYLEQIENTVVMRVLEQEGITRNLSDNIRVSITPYLNEGCMYLRGKKENFDNSTSCRVLSSVKDAEIYLNKLLVWLDEAFEIDRNDQNNGNIVYVSNDNETWKSGVFFCEIEGTAYPYVIIDKDAEERFNSFGSDILVSGYRYMKRQLNSNYNPETHIYEYNEK